MPINPRDRQREVAIQIRLQAGFERGLQRRLSAEFRRSATAAGQGFEDGGVNGVLHALRDHIDRLTADLEAFQFGVGKAMGDRVINAVRGFQKDEESIFDTSLRNWVRERSLERAELVGQTTIQRARDAILAGQAEGEGSIAIARRIETALGGTIAGTRARTIARTEVHTAANVASLQATDSTGVQGLRREWLAAEDGRTRLSHAIADGQTVGMNETFSVGGSKLRFPGDPKGPASEIINCRCAVAYVTPDFDGPDFDTPAPTGDDLQAAVEREQDEARRFVVRSGRRAGNKIEYLAGIDLDTGERVFEHTSGLPSQVIFTDFIMATLSNARRRIDMHHNHPSGGSLSDADLGALHGLPGMDRVVAHGHDRSLYAARRTDATPDEIRRAYRVGRGVINRTMAGLTGGNLRPALVRRHAAHLINTALAELGLVAYDSRLGKRRQRELSENVNAFNGIVAEIIDDVKLETGR